MTLNGAIKQLHELRSAEDMPIYYKPAIAEVINVLLMDAREVKRGRWVLDDNPHDGDCRCSVCGIAIDQMHERHHGLLNALTGGKWWTFYKFCPFCGADMRGEANEGTVHQDGTDSEGQTEILRRTCGHTGEDTQV